MSERVEYFKQEKEVQMQNERDARLLVWAPCRLLREAEKIVAQKLKMDEKKVRDFV